MLYDSQPLPCAHLVGQVSHTEILALAAVVFLSIPHTDGVKNEMIVERSCVKMGGNQHLIFVSPHLSGKFNTELVALLRRDLAGHETLISMIRNVLSAGLSETLLHVPHFLKSGFHFAVDAGYGMELFAFRHDFLLVGSVFDDVLQIGELRLFRIIAVIDHAGDTILYRPDLRHRHRLRPPFRDKDSEESP